MKQQQGPDARARNCGAASRRDRGQQPGQAPGSQEGWRMASRAGWAWMPGQVMRAGQAPRQAAPSFPSQGWMINNLPGQAGEKDPSPCHEATNWETEVEEEQRQQHNLLLQTGHSLPFMPCPPKVGPPPQCQQQLCTQRQHRIGPGACAFNTDHAKKGPGTATSCPAITSPSGPSIS